MPDLGSLYAECALRVAKQVYLVVQDEQIATRAVNEAFARAGSEWDVVAADPSPEGWIRAEALRLATGPRAKLVLAWRRLRDSRRRNAGRHRVSRHPADAWLLEVLRELPTVQVTALVLHHVAGLWPDEIALETESTVGAAATRIHAAETAVGRAMQLTRQRDDVVSPQEVAEELAQLARRTDLSLVPPVRAQRLPERRARRALWLTGGAAASVLLVLGLAAAIGRGGGASLTSAATAAPPSAAATPPSTGGTGRSAASGSSASSGSLASGSAAPSASSAASAASGPGAASFLPQRDSPPDVATAPSSGRDFGFVRGAFRYGGQIYVEFDRARLRAGRISNASTQWRVLPVAANAFVEPGGRSPNVTDLLRRVVLGDGTGLPLRLRYDNGEIESFEELN